jgi:hypothetical protein
MADELSRLDRRLAEKRGAYFGFHTEAGPARTEDLALPAARLTSPTRASYAAGMGFPLAPSSAAALDGRGRSPRSELERSGSGVPAPVTD